MPGRVSRPKTAHAFDTASIHQNGGPSAVSKSTKKRGAQKRRQRGLNAFAIASYETAEHGKRSGLKRSRLQRDDGEALNEDDPLAPLDSDDGSAENSDGDSDDDDGADGSGPRRKKPRLVAGEDDLDADDDEDIDSDEAFGESDEERFEGFVFRGSSSTNGKAKQKAKSLRKSATDDDIDLQEDDDDDSNSDNKDDESLGQDAIDLAQMLDDDDYEDDDMVSEAEEEDSNNGHSRDRQIGVRDSTRSGGGVGGSSDDEDASEVDGRRDDDGDSDTSASSYDYEFDHDPDDRDGDTGKDSSEQLQKLQQFVSTLPSASKDSDDTAVRQAQPTAARMLAALKTMPALDPAFARSVRKFSAANEAMTKNSTNAKERSGVVQPPLPKRQQDRIDRAVAYDKAKETLNEWLDTVKLNRRAEHLSFPLRDSAAQEPQGTSKFLPTEKASGDGRPANPLESVIQNILEESGLAGSAKDEEKRIREAEKNELAANKISTEEILARRAELRRSRDLLFHEERRAKRIKKIKSKSYRRVHRKEAERAAQKEKNLLAAAGIEESEDEEEKEKHDRRRAEERMGARHRESKWAKSARDAGRAKWDQEAQDGMVEMAKRSEDLRKRIEGKRVSTNSDDEDSVSESDSDLGEAHEGDEIALQRQLDAVSGRVQENDAGPLSRLANMKFMQRAEAARKKANDEAVEQLRRELAANSDGEEDGQGPASEEERDEEVQEAVSMGRMLFGPGQSMRGGKGGLSSAKLAAVAPQKQKQRQRNELEEGFSSEEDEPQVDTGEGDVDKERSKELKSQPQQQTKAMTTKNGKTGSKAVQGAEKLGYQGSAKQFDVGTTGKNTQQKGGAQATTQPSTDPTEARPNPPSNMAGWTKVSLSAGKNKKSCSTALAVPASTSPILSNPQVEKLDVDARENTDAGDENGDGGGDADDAESPFVSPSNLELVRAAFGGGDEAEAEFAQEKRDAEESEDEKVSSSAMPGWGSWTGEGLSKRDKRDAAKRAANPRLQVKTPGIKPADRKDAQLERVILSEKRVRKNAKYLAPALPHPFESKLQYERSLRLPIGPEWTTKETFQRATKPRVLVKPGVIAPMRKPLI